MEFKHIKSRHYIGMFGSLRKAKNWTKKYGVKENDYIFVALRNGQRILYVYENGEWKKVKERNNENKSVQ